jgi:hypothetical protein
MKSIKAGALRRSLADEDKAEASAKAAAEAVRAEAAAGAIRRRCGPQ